MARFANRKGFAPHFSHQPLPFATARKFLERPNVVHMDISRLLTAEFANPALYPRGIAVRAFMFSAVFGQSVRL